MEKLAHEIYSFDEFQLDLTRGSVFRGVDELKLRPKSFEVLKYLAQNQGRLVGKDELIDFVWQGTAVTDDSLVQCLKDIRRTLGDEAQQFIRTVPRRGYIFDKEIHLVGTAILAEETTSIHVVIEGFEETNGNSASPETEHAGGNRADLTAAIKRHWVAAADLGRGYEFSPEEFDDESTSRLQLLNTQISQLPPVRSRSIRIEGLFRGLKFIFGGVAISFIFLVVFQILQIFSVVNLDKRMSLPAEASIRLLELIDGLLSLLYVPAIVSYLFGFDLILFGFSRMIYALFQRSRPKDRFSLIEKLLFLLTTAVIIAIAVPNLLTARNSSGSIPKTTSVTKR